MIDEMVSVSHWGMFERPIVIVRHKPVFDGVFPYPRLKNSPLHVGCFVGIKA